jgi:hypothetical protein
VAIKDYHRRAEARRNFPDVRAMAAVHASSESATLTTNVVILPGDVLKIGTASQIEMIFAKLESDDR